ncbi:hypothetical protein VOA_003505 [Vibrio sp. RC586]|nr:hypothetical protein VOA_003505 [Vibrio sp. RC586]
MADKVKTPFDIALQYPTGTRLAAEIHETCSMASAQERFRRKP